MIGGADLGGRSLSMVYAPKRVDLVGFSTLEAYENLAASERCGENWEVPQLFLQKLSTWDVFDGSGPRFLTMQPQPLAGSDPHRIPRVSFPPHLRGANPISIRPGQKCCDQAVAEMEYAYRSYRLALSTASLLALVRSVAAEKSRVPEEKWEKLGFPGPPIRGLLQKSLQELSSSTQSHHVWLSKLAAQFYSPRAVSGDQDGLLARKLISLTEEQMVNYHNSDVKLDLRNGLEAVLREQTTTTTNKADPRRRHDSHAQLAVLATTPRNTRGNKDQQPRVPGGVWI